MPVTLNSLSLQRKVRETRRKQYFIINPKDPKQILMAENDSNITNKGTLSEVSAKGRKVDLKDFMEKHYKSDMSMSEFAKASGRSLSTFKRDFKRMSELSPERWLTDRRLRAACELLKRGRRVSDACFDVGFKNVSHFSAIFKKKFGLTPGEVRKGEMQ
jgi:AraC-like DNA-binding protein